MDRFFKIKLPKISIGNRTRTAHYTSPPANLPTVALRPSTPPAALMPSSSERRRRRRTYRKSNKSGSSASVAESPRIVVSAAPVPVVEQIVSKSPTKKATKIKIASPVRLPPIQKSLLGLEASTIDPTRVAILEEFIKVETKFRTLVEEEYGRFYGTANSNVCCTDFEREALLSIAILLKTAYPRVSNKDICIAVLFSYYAIHLNEQTEYDFEPDMYRLYADSHLHVTDLYWRLCTGDIMSGNINISSKFRQIILLSKP
jgi:hypothetical protein